MIGKKRKTEKIITTWADSADDPIYNSGFVISSNTFDHGLKQSNKSSQTDTDGLETTPSNSVLPDLQNLPFDPAEEALKVIQRTESRLGKKK
jgi:hypothetical protein